MTPDHENSQAIRERLLRHARKDAEREISTTIREEEVEDWTMPLALLGGLAVAVIANTFVSILPI